MYVPCINTTALFSQLLLLKTNDGPMGAAKYRAIVVNGHSRRAWIHSLKDVQRAALPDLRPFIIGTKEFLTPQHHAIFAFEFNQRYFGFAAELTKWVVPISNNWIITNVHRWANVSE